MANVLRLKSTGMGILMGGMLKLVIKPIMLLNGIRFTVPILEEPRVTSFVCLRMATLATTFVGLERLAVKYIVKDSWMSTTAASATTTASPFTMLNEREAAMSAVTVLFVRTVTKGHGEVCVTLIVRFMCGYFVIPGMVEIQKGKSVESFTGEFAGTMAGVTVTSRRPLRSTAHRAEVSVQPVMATFALAAGNLSRLGTAIVLATGGRMYCPAMFGKTDPSERYRM